MIKDRASQEVDKTVLTAFILFSAFFICGAVAGAYVARYANFGQSDFYSGFITLTVSGEYVIPGFFDSLWSICRSHLMAIFLGMSLLGIFLIPLLFAMRGFVLSYSVYAIVASYGAAPGWGLAFAIIGMAAFVSVPVLFAVGIKAYQLSSGIIKTVIQPAKKDFILVSGRDLLKKAVLCVVLLLIAAAMETFLSPLLIDLFVPYI